MIEEKLYQLICKTIPIPTVDVVLKYHNKILLVKRGKSPAKDLWWTVGGRQELNETLENAAIRKLNEEVGVSNAHIIGSIGSVDTIFDERHNVTSVVLAYIYEEPQIKLNADHYDFMWYDGENIIIHPYLQKILKYGSSKNNVCATN